MKMPQTQEEKEWINLGNSLPPTILHFIYGIHFCMFESDFYVDSPAAT